MRDIKAIIRILTIVTLGIIAFGPPHPGQAAQEGTDQEDIYESDDTCEEATTIQPDGTVQTHNFHDEGDTDWVMFTAPTDGTYDVVVSHLENSRANADVGYDIACPLNGNILTRRSISVPSDSNLNSLFSIQASAGESFYIWIWNYDSSVFGSDVSYTLSVSLSVQPSLTSGAIIIVAGRHYLDDSLQDNIHNAALNIFEMFRNRGESEDNISFLATDSALSGYDAQATLSNLEYVITHWAAERVSANQALTIYLIFHWDSDESFSLDKVSNEMLTPELLDLWLTTLEISVPNLKSNIIIEAGLAGRFIDLAGSSISKENRVIITSTDKDNAAFASQNGAVFTDNLYHHLGKGENLRDSFEKATSVVDILHPSQNPWIDADGDGIPNETEDMDIAATRGFEYPGTLGGGFMIESPSTTIDTYEPDYDCHSATDIPVDGEAQTHNLTPSTGLDSDTDWVKFDAISGQIYTVDIVAIGEDGDFYLEYYFRCSSNPEVRSRKYLSSRMPYHISENIDETEELFGENLRIIIESDQNAPYYIRIAHNQSTYGPDTRYQVSVTTDTMPTPIDTPVPTLTDTFTPSPTPTDTLTNTPIPPTHTPTDTLTPSPTLTETPTSTDTVVPPTSTPTPTFTSTATPTATPTDTPIPARLQGSVAVVDPMIAMGDAAIWNITLANVGALSAQETQLEFVLPPDTELAPESKALCWVCDGEICVLELGILGPNREIKTLLAIQPIQSFARTTIEEPALVVVSAALAEDIHISLGSINDVTVALIPTRTPSPTPTHTATPPSPLDDVQEYEPNDRCEDVGAIATDGIAQIHTLDTEADQDWATFTATTAGIYRVAVHVPSGSRADVDLAYFDSCDAGSRQEENSPDTLGASMDIQAQAGQQFYLKLYHVDSNVYGPDVTYKLSVYRLPSEQPTGAVIILAGRRKNDDTLQSNINQTAEDFYKLAQSKGVAIGNILLLTTDSTIQGHDKQATKFNLRDGIIDWARDKVGDRRSLTLYIVDHGARDLFYIDEVNEEYVSSTELDTWLSELEQAVPGLEINIIIEACHSGSFIDSEGGRISSPGRLIITSTDVDSDAYASPNGKGIVFSDAFISQLRKGNHLANAFDSARGHAQSVFDYQEPWLDGNGNGIPNEGEDVHIAARRTFDFPSVLSDKLPPYIAQVQPPQMAHRRGTFQAEVRDDAGVDDVRAVVYPPDYRPRQCQGNGVMDTGDGLDQVLFEPRTDLGENIFEGSYSGFAEDGIYQLVFYAIDIDGLHAQPRIVPVHVHTLYLPTVSR